MRRNQVRNQVSDSIEHGFDKLNRVADRCVVYPLAAVEGAVQGVARGVHNWVTHSRHPWDRATAVDPSVSWYMRKPQPVGPYQCNCGCPPPSIPAPTPPPPPQFQYHPAYPVPCRPPY